MASGSIDVSNLPAATLESLEKARPKSISLRELHEGDGAVAEAGAWVTVHYTVTLLGDDTVIEETRTSGYGDRDYGQPLTFEVGDLGDNAALRALHAIVLDMRVGGRRRGRTAIAEPDFGYREPPAGVYSRDCEGRRYERRLQGDWLIDVEVSLLSVSDHPPPSPYARLARSVLPTAAVDVLHGLGVL